MSVKILSGRSGWHLKVNGLYINRSFDDPPKIKAIKSEHGIPFGATEFVSVQVIRNFWKDHRKEIISSTKTPYRSVWGNLEKI